MKATILVDNIKNEIAEGEWGLSILVEYGEKKVLLDVGASGLFLENAKKLGIELQDVDYAVLSHAHYDHADGMKHFFEYNDHTKFYLRDSCKENCYWKKLLIHKYIGLPKGIMEEYSDRIIYATGDVTLCEGVYLIPHKMPNMQLIGKKANMYQRQGRKWIPDDFSHEQSLVFDTLHGLVIFNSCSHGGVDNIIHEVEQTFQGKKVIAMIGGFHLFDKPEKEVREIAKKIRDTGISCIYTGHCTGKKSYDILKEELGDVVNQIKVGLEIVI